MAKFNEVTVTMDVKSDQETVWDLTFNQFGNVNIFNPLIIGSHLVHGTPGEIGSVRECQLDHKTAIQEKITDARGHDSFDIDIIKGKLPMMKQMNATIELEKLGKQETRVYFTMRFISKPAWIGVLMKGKMRKMVHKLLLGLKYHLETGNHVSHQDLEMILKKYKALHPENGQGSLVPAF